MAVSVKISNSKCRNACEYCYEQIIRKKGRADRPLEMDKVKEQMEKEVKRKSDGKGSCNTPYLHGGEIFLAGKDNIKELLKKAYELSGSSSLQTYGHLIDRDYIEMFKKYDTHVGISFDGPWPLNELRKVPGKDTKDVTNRVMQNILEMRNAGISVGMICILHKSNAIGERREQLKEWLLWLYDNGITGGRLNPASVYDFAQERQLTPEEAAEAWTDLGEFLRTNIPDHNWKPFRDAFDNLMGMAQGTCIFDVCQFYHAHTEPVVLSDGKTANCFKPGMRTGHVYPRYPTYNHWQDNNPSFGKVRYEILPKVEKEDGGCKGCKYWRNCLGGCAGNTINQDWRNRSKFCKAYYALFEWAEETLRSIMPNLILSTDEGVTFKDDYGIRGMEPNPFAYMTCSNARPSIWRGTQGKINFLKHHAGRQEEKEAPAEVEHLDNGLRHLDSDAGKRKKQQQVKSPGDVKRGSEIEHIDGDVRHLDSDHSDLN